jgi:methionyl-tRNA synthetase
LSFHEALQKIIGLINAANKFIDERAPWKTAKTDLPAALQALHEVLRALKLSAVALHPFMPVTTQEMWSQLGEPEELPLAAKKILQGAPLRFQDGQVIKKGPPLFPRKESPLP